MNDNLPNEFNLVPFLTNGEVTSHSVFVIMLTSVSLNIKYTRENCD